ncbi:putative heat shock 70 kDa protein 14-like [Apostichopus japonicus]|uniref:Putative heat shock 70 kDa protein 14-like n=1 Tax=Stichopus japonicus TaxID=307972 RepID=A0A2G8LCU3_STIJA|nr:putative heat shock 70 kDa protein 14-like [Apostichopus japonicus]
MTKSRKKVTQEPKKNESEGTLFKMAASIGIHVGGTSSCLALEKDGKIDVVANDLGDRTTPAVVSFSDREKIVGLAAKQGQFRNPSKTITGATNLLGKKFSDPSIEEEKNRSQVAIVEKNGAPVYQIECNERSQLVTPEEVISMIMSKLKETAEHQGGCTVKELVLTLPVDEATTDYETSLRAAAQKAGFDVLRCISEHAAGALAYDLGQTSPKQISFVVIFKFGGKSLSISVLRIQGGIYQTVTSQLHTDVNGNLLTNQLAKVAAEDFKRQFKADISDNKRAVAKLRNACENCKHILSRLNSASLSVDSLYDGIDFHNSISRAKFEAVANGILQQCGMYAEKAVVLMGGSSCIPKLQQLLKDRFPTAELKNSISPEEVAAIGAAKEASIILSCHDEGISLQDEDLSIPALSQDVIVKVKITLTFLGFITFLLNRSVTDESGTEERFTVLQRGAYLPVRRHQTFRIGQGVSSVTVLVSTVATPEAEPQPLGQVVISSLDEADVENGHISATFHFKRDGSLDVTCTADGSGKQETLNINGA